MNCKIYYYDEANYNNYFNDKLKPLPKLVQSKDPKKAIFNSNENDEEFEEIQEPSDGNEKIKKANLIKIL